MFSFFVANLLIPGEPDTVDIQTPSGVWQFGKFADYQKSVAAIKQGQCATTYFIENPIPLVPNAASEAAFNELTPILLAASFATGLAVTIRQSTQGSSVMFTGPLNSWPRDRAIDMASPVVNSADEFRELVEKFVTGFSTLGRSEKALLLVHHWLDSMACWSLEDLYLSATTLLQIIVATEEDRQGVSRLYYYDGVDAAAQRMGIQTLSPDFKNMRNELVHSGQLVGTRFAGPDKDACAKIAVDVLNWFDEYLHKALALGPVRKTRFTYRDLSALNAYSIPE